MSLSSLVTEKVRADSAANLSTAVFTELRNQLRKEQIETDTEECLARGKPYNSWHKSDGSFSAIIYPDNTEDVSKVMKICQKHNISVVACGGGTSLEGQITAPPVRSISIDFRNMKKILELNESDLDVRVQAGLGYIELNDILVDKNLWFPLDPGPGASIGGMCACRCSGSTAVRYGSMRDNVLNITAVLADGTVFKTGSRARKSSAGYDLTRLLIGSEGTLAVITEVTLKLHGLPAHTAALRVAFPDLRSAATTAQATLNCGVTVGRCELLDDSMVRISNKANPTSEPWLEKSTLLYEVTGVSTRAVEEQLEIVKTIAKQHGGSDFVLTTDKHEAKKLWAVRKALLWSVMSEYPDREAMITDACVPVGRLAEVIAAMRQEIDASFLPSPIVAHAGDGNFHCVIMLRPTVKEDVVEAKRLLDIMARTAIAMGGTCTGEHGIGVGKKELLKLEMGAGSMALMRSIKRVADPHHLLNPGKVLDLCDVPPAAPHPHPHPGVDPAAPLISGLCNKHNCANVCA